jgi:hypothetical protein
MQPKVGVGFDLPEGNDGWSDWTWFHARYPTPQRFTILCNTPVHYGGHFRKGRMVPCAGEDCPLCEMGLGSQARYVFSVVEWETRRIGLLELGRGHTLQVQDWMAQNGGLRGMSIEIVRSGAPKQSKVDMTLVANAAPLFFQHMEGPDLERALKSTWQRSASQSLHESLPGVSPQRDQPGEVRRRQTKSA